MGIPVAPVTNIRYAPGTSFWGREWAAASTRGLRDSQDHLWYCQPIIEFSQDWGLSDLHCFVEYSRASHKIEAPLRTNKRQVIHIMLPIDYQTSGMSENKDIVRPPRKILLMSWFGPRSPWALKPRRSTGAPRSSRAFILPPEMLPNHSRMCFFSGWEYIWDWRFQERSVESR